MLRVFFTVGVLQRQSHLRVSGAQNQRRNAANLHALNFNVANFRQVHPRFDGAFLCGRSVLCQRNHLQHACPLVSVRHAAEYHTNARLRVTRLAVGDKGRLAFTPAVHDSSARRVPGCTLLVHNTARPSLGPGSLCGAPQLWSEHASLALRRTHVLEKRHLARAVAQRGAGVRTLAAAARTVVGAAPRDRGGALHHLAQRRVAAQRCLGVDDSVLAPARFARAPCSRPVLAHGRTIPRPQVVPSLHASTRMNASDQAHRKRTGWLCQPEHGLGGGGRGWRGTLTWQLQRRHQVGEPGHYAHPAQPIRRVGVGTAGREKCRAGCGS